MTSAASLTGSYHASCASDAEESSFLKQTRYLRWIRIGLAFIILGVSVSLIACEAVPYRYYKKTSSYERVELYLWPLNLDIRPTIAMLACGCVVAFLSLFFIVVALLPSPHSHIRRINMAGVAKSVCGFITALIGVVFAIYLPGSLYPSGFSENETLHSWTCKWKVSHSVPSVLSSGDNEAAPPPSHFARDCAATHAGFALLGLLIGLEVLMIIASGLGTWLELSVAKKRMQGQYQLEKIEMMTKHGQR
ncbi:hypothetical protein ARAM_004862 [Aspergillus rambellii]|uniref:Uncharacterized protein n=1 Tax=Aspergillus rambellii TaxID=308745 RepID=A0A0F8W2W1_9EURO|nr:hypothetical protein ARAM_004862 [Aspergillus rambellii]